MKHLFKTLLKTMLCSALVASLPIQSISGELNYEEEMKLLEVQVKNLDEVGLWGFFDTAQSNQWAAPKIHSQCWVDWLPTDQEKLKRLERGRRDFGLGIVKAVEREALHTLLPTSTVERANQATRLLNFSDWVGKPDGYGNLAIKRRVDNLACIPIGHLVANLDYPMEKIEALFARFETEGGWLRMQRNVLNEESPHKYDARTKDELAVQWHGYFRKAAFAFKEAKGRYPYNHSESLELPREISFYCEDETSPPPQTLATKWNTKRHYIFCVMGYEDTITERVKNFLLFRKTIGRFPEKPSRPLGLFKGEEIREAFYEAWMPHEKKYSKKGSGAARSFTDIQRNAFMDYDTSELVSFMREKVVPGEQGKADRKAAE